MAKPTGRPVDYKPEYADLARNYCLLGATLDTLGEFFDVSKRTIIRWKQRFPEFQAAIDEGSRHANAKVTGRLYDKCMDGDTTAIIWWQKNRMGWRDKVDHGLHGPNGERLIFEISTVAPQQEPKPE